MIKFVSQQFLTEISSQATYHSPKLRYSSCVYTGAKLTIHTVETWLVILDFSLSDFVRYQTSRQLVRYSYVRYSSNAYQTERMMAVTLEPIIINIVQNWNPVKTVKYKAHHSPPIITSFILPSGSTFKSTTFPPSTLPSTTVFPGAQTLNLAPHLSGQAPSSRIESPAKV